MQPMNDHESIIPVLDRLDRAALDEFHRCAVKVTLPAGRFICSEGDRCAQVPILLKGSARVYKTGAAGREITLYRIEPGETCILTASCVISGTDFPAYAVTDQECEAWVIPAPTFAAWIDRFQPWREFIFNLLSRRFASLIEVVEEVAFRRLDSRVASYLIQASGDGPEIHATHEAIAFDLGSSREVISRVLKEFEREGMVMLARGHVTVVDPDGLGERGALVE